MRETKNLKLTQFDPNDIPNWLKEYNADMEKIDNEVGRQDVVNTGYETRFENNEEKIQNNRNQINENVQDIANIKDDVKNIKGDSTDSIATLKKKVDGVEHSLTILKGDSDKTIDDIENDLAEHKTDITALGGRVETLDETTETLVGDVTELKGKEHDISSLKTKVGTTSTSNFGSSVSGAIGNTELGISTDSVPISDVLNTMLNKFTSVELETGNAGSISAKGILQYLKNSSLFVPGALAMRIESVSGTLAEGTHILATISAEKLPNIKPSMHMYLFDLDDMLNSKDKGSTSTSQNVYLDVANKNLQISVRVKGGSYKFTGKVLGTSFFPIVLPINPF